MIATGASDWAAPGTRTWAPHLLALTALATFVGLAVFLRVHRAAEPALWGDEANTLFRARLPLSEMLHTLAYRDTHPPLPYLLLKPWIAVLGESEGSLRGFAALWGTLAVPLAWWVGRQLSNSMLGGWISALLITTHPVLVIYGREGRGYSMLAFLGLAAFAALVLALRAPSKRAWALYTATTAASLYTHNLAFLWLAWQAVVVAAAVWHTRNQRLLVGFGLAQTTAYALYFPWLVFFVGQVTSLAGGGGWLPPFEPRMMVVSVLNYLGAANYLRLGDMRPALDSVTFLLFIGPMLLFFGGLRGMRGTARWQALALAVLPVPVLGAAATIVPVYVDRGLIVTAVGVCLVPAGVAALPRTRVTHVIMGLALTATLTLYLRSFGAYLGRPVDDFRGMAADLRLVTQPGDTVIFLPWFGSDATRYYWEQAPGAAHFLASEEDVAPLGGLSIEALRGGAVWIVRVPAPPPRSAIDLPSRLEQAGLHRQGIRYYPDRMLSVELFTMDVADSRGLHWLPDQPFVAPQRHEQDSGSPG